MLSGAPAAALWQPSAELSRLRAAQRKARPELRPELGASDSSEERKRAKPCESMRTHAPSHSTPAPRWMGRWLLAAAVYNLLWGLAMALAPVWTLGFLGVSPESREIWPQLWACIGMIVGVYGIGFLIASRNPLRHWPIVLVALLGKIFGPIGFVDAALRGALPWSMGVTILTNDLLWWIPFSMILWNAFRASQPAPPEGEVTLESALASLHDQDGRALRELTNLRPTLVVLLRHTGCTFCKEALADLARWEASIGAAGVGVAVVGMSPTAQHLRAHGERRGLRTVAWIADPDRKLYRALAVPRGTFPQLFGPRVMLGAARAMLGGHRLGALEGDGFQMPGAFVIHQGRVVREYRHSTAADRPDLAALACPVGG